ncbi:MAG TPA: efflux RND transporter periplasmic adaptor subunit, partial [Acidobacteriaceae bacterium]
QAQQAAVAAGQAQVQAAEAQVRAAQLNVGFTQVRSLVTGIAGQAALQVGNLVSTSSVLTSVSQVSPIKVYFSISEQDYLALSSKVKAAGKKDLLSSGTTIPLQLTLANGESYPHPGSIIFVDRSVSAQTGSLRIAASFPNPGNLLRPGQFARIKAETDVKQDAILIPQRAMAEVQGKYQVAVVSPDNTVRMANVVPGAQFGSDIVISSGLKGGDQVVTEGIDKLQEGAKVSPQLVPGNGSRPTPSNASASPAGPSVASAEKGR